MASNDEWLNSIITTTEKERAPESSKVGRPRKLFLESGIRSKLKKVENLGSTASVEEFAFATEVQLKKKGKHAAAAVVNEVTMSTPKRARKYQRVYKSMQQCEATVNKIKPEEALAVVINTKSSKTSYLSYRMLANVSNANIFPSWNKIPKAKQKCYPDQNAILITATEAKI